MSAPHVILFVEDREDDVKLITRAFEQAGVDIPVHIVRDGEEAMLYLAGEGKYAVRDEYPLPTVMLLDLKMPRVDGFEVLNCLKTQPSLSSLVVIVLTNSEDIRDVNRAYDLGANSFLVKPFDFADTKALGKLIHDYWLRTNAPPTTNRPPANGPKKKEPQ